VSGEARKQAVEQAQASALPGTAPRAHVPPAGPPSSADALMNLQRAAGNRATSNALESAASDVRVVPDGGQPLAASLRDEMEERFGHDFTQVRVHTGGDASRAARAVSAKAYTFGRDIVFDKGTFATQTVEGRHLLAHELAHVVQQGRGGSAAPRLSPHTPLERSAERAASAFSHGEGSVVVAGRSAPAVARVYRKSAAPASPVEEMAAELNEELGLDPAGTTRVTSAARAARDARKAGFTKGLYPGIVDLAVQSHGSARDVRKVLKVVGRNIESAHIAPTAALKTLKNYGRSEALTTLMPKNLHRQFDAHWKSWARTVLAERKAAGLKGDALNKVTVKELRTAVENAIEALPNADEDHPFVPGQNIPRPTKNAMQWKLFDELHGKLGLKPDDLVKLPYSPLRTRIAGALKKGAGPVTALLGAAMRYRDLRETGHGQAESGAAAGAHLGLAGVLELASRSPDLLTKAQAGRMGGGGIGTAVTLANMALQTLGAPKKVTDVTKTASDVVPANMAGNMLEVTARAGSNLLRGDWRGFDRTMKDVTEGGAGMPLEGIFKTFTITTDIQNDIVNQLSYRRHLKGAVSRTDVKDVVEDSIEHNILKQKFSGATENVWNVTTAPVLLREIKFAEGLARGKGLKRAMQESKEMEKNAPINRAIDYTEEQGVRFLTKDLPEARELASRDLDRIEARVTETVEEKKQAAKSYVGEKLDAARRFLPF
jgi:hypothetical protein